MTIDQSVEAKIFRFHHVEGWGVFTIATQLGVHHSTVDRVLAQSGLPKIERATRASIIDPFLPFLVETLDQHPTLSAQRLYEMAQVRGFRGGISHFRAKVAELRPRKRPEAYLRLSLNPGEVCQVDWGLCRVLSYAEYLEKAPERSISMSDTASSANDYSA